MIPLPRLYPSLLIFAALGLGGCATPTDAPRQEPTAGAPAPVARAPEWQHTATHDFEHDYPGKGLGVSRRYDSEDGWTDIYIYDLGHSWADGCSDPDFAAAFDMACDDIRTSGKTGHYAELTHDAPQSMEGKLPMRWARFAYVHNGKKIESYLIMTCARGRIIKARASLFVPASRAARDSVFALVEQQLRLIN